MFGKGVVQTPVQMGLLQWFFLTKILILVQTIWFKPTNQMAHKCHHNEQKGVGLFFKDTQRTNNKSEGRD